MEAKQDISKEQDRADGNRAVMRRSFSRGQKAICKEAGVVIKKVNRRFRTALVEPDWNLVGTAKFRWSRSKWVSWDELS